MNYWAQNSALSGGYAQICVQRSPETYAAMAPLTTSSGECPSGYTKCGSSPENVFCTKQSKCPINSIMVATVGSTSNCTSKNNCSILSSAGSLSYNNNLNKRGY